MTGYVTFTLAAYLSLSVLGLRSGIDRYGLETTAAGFIGLILTGLHAILPETGCAFELWNTVIVHIIWVFFIGLFFIIGATENDKK